MRALGPSSERSSCPNQGSPGRPLSDSHSFLFLTNSPSVPVPERDDPAQVKRLSAQVQEVSAQEAAMGSVYLRRVDHAFRLLRYYKTEKSLFRLPLPHLAGVADLLEQIV